MPSKEPFPAESLHAVPSPLPVGSFSIWERAVLGLDVEGLGEDGQPESPLAWVDREHEAWPFGVASQVFLKSNALSTALAAAQQAHLVASRCCMDCVAWNAEPASPGTPRAGRGADDEGAPASGAATDPACLRGGGVVRVVHHPCDLEAAESARTVAPPRHHEGVSIPPERRRSWAFRRSRSEGDRRCRNAWTPRSASRFTS